MQCKNPFTRRYLDSLTGEMKTTTCRCGKCEGCRHYMQDQWLIRLSEELKDKKYVVYDTLTVSPGSMHEIDLRKPVASQSTSLRGSFHIYGRPDKEVFWTPEDGFIMPNISKWNEFHRLYPHWSQESFNIIRRNGMKLLSFPQEELQKWFKRGRIAYERFYGHKPNMSYFVVQELGTVTSRPHFHILFFGLPYQDYMRFWGTPWKSRFGHTKPKLLLYNALDLKHTNRVFRYVTKYIMKGSDESSLVLDGIYKKPYRLMSKGIGSAFADDYRFSSFTDYKWNHLKNITCDSETVYNRRVEELKTDPRALLEYKAAQRQAKAEVDAYYRKKREYDFITEVCTDFEPETTERLHDELVHFDEKLLDRLIFVGDQGGYLHALPKYYKDKIFKNGNKTNIYANEVSSILLANRELHTNQAISEFALVNFGLHIDPGAIHFDGSLESTIEGLSPVTSHMVFNGYTIAQRRKAQVDDERSHIKTRNFFNRIKYRTDAPALL